MFTMIDWKQVFFGRLEISFCSETVFFLIFIAMFTMVDWKPFFFGRLEINFCFETIFFLSFLQCLLSSEHSVLLAQKMATVSIFIFRSFASTQFFLIFSRLRGLILWLFCTFGDKKNLLGTK